MSEEKKNEILEEKLDTEELDAVSGGGLPTGDNCKDPSAEETKYWSNRHGGCDKAFYKQKCKATVEHGSWCWSNDLCSRWSENYTIKD